MQFDAASFQTRAALDQAVIAECGANIIANRSAGHTITGTSDDLKRLLLSASSDVYGVRVVLAT